REAIMSLRRFGIRKTIMLTGDNSTTARAVADRLGIDDVEAELLPEDKVNRIRDLVARHKHVAMIGDGINDAPALAAASVGIAMGGAGTHAALETADVALMADDLSMLPYGIKLSRASLRTIKQNIAFSVLVVITLVVMTLAGWLNLTAGIIGHEGSALLVIANGMRLLRLRA
ncbi:MAG TPA: HAD-IC family P-type ATPase, partial [Armatimonadota bacterium]|nr:HAD-IC family P-type ATPase [Armatimonadota bacterium]